MILKTLILVLFFSLNIFYANDDNQSWSSINFEVKTPFSTKFKVKQSLRLKNQLFEFKQTYTEVSLSYKINDLFKLSVPYRYAIYKDKTKNRLSIEIGSKLDKNHVLFKSRLKFQNTKEFEKEIDQTLRNKFLFFYKFNKNLMPFIAYEIFNPYKNKFNQIDEVRFSIGSQIKINKKKYLKFYFMQKKEDLTKVKANSVNILGIDYSLNL